MSESESERKEEAPVEKKGSTPAPCPVLPSSVEEILKTLDQLDKGEIDEFDAVQQVTSVMKEHRRVKLEALKKLETPEQEEETAERIAEETGTE